MNWMKFFSDLIKQNGEDLKKVPINTEVIFSNLVSKDEKPWLFDTLFEEQLVISKRKKIKSIFIWNIII